MKVEVKNNFLDGGCRAADIIIYGYKVFSESEGVWMSRQNIKNVTIKAGDTATLPEEDLESAENDRLTAIEIKFAYKESDGDFSKTFYQIDDMNDIANCHAGETLKGIDVDSKAPSSLSGK